MARTHEYMHMPDAKDRLSSWHIMQNFDSFKEWVEEFFVELFDKGYELRFDTNDRGVGIFLLKSGLTEFDYVEVSDDLIKFLSILSDEYLVHDKIYFKERIVTYNDNMVAYSYYDLYKGEVGDSKIVFIAIKL